MEHSDNVELTDEKASRTYLVMGEDEYIALRKAINNYESPIPTAQLAISLGTDEETICAYLTGRTSLNAQFALTLQALTGILV